MSPSIDDERGRRHNNKRQRLDDDESLLSGSGGGNAAAARTEVRSVRGGGRGRAHDDVSVDYSVDNDDGEAVGENIPWCLRDPNPPTQAKTTALKKLVGSRLEPIKKLLAPHPTSFITTTIASSNAMLTLLLNIKQREISFLRFDSQVVVRDNNGKAVIDDVTNKEKTVAFIPRSIRGKNPVQCSADVREDDRIVAALADSQARHDAHQTAMAADIKKVARLELTIRKEKLGAMFLELAFELAKQFYIFLKTTKELETEVERDVLAHASVLLTLKSLSEDDEISLRNTRTALADSYTKKHGLNLAEDGFEEHINSAGALEIKCVLQPLLFGATAGLIKHHDRRDDFRAGHAALREYAEMQQQTEANKDLERGKEEEDAMTKALDNFLENFTKIASDNHVARLKSILKVKYSAGGENHASAKSNNGAGRSTRPAANTGGKSKRGSAKPSNNSNRQRGNQNKKDGRKSTGRNNQNHNNQNNNTRGRSRSRSYSRNAGRSSRNRSRSDSRVRFSREDEAKARRDNQHSYGGHNNHNNGNRRNNNRGGGHNRRNEDYDDGYYDGRPQRRPSASSSGYSRRKDRSRSRSRSRSNRGDRGSRDDHNNGWRSGGARRR